MLQMSSGLCHSSTLRIRDGWRRQHLESRNCTAFCKSLHWAFTSKLSNSLCSSTRNAHRNGFVEWTSCRRSLPVRQFYSISRLRPHRLAPNQHKFGHTTSRSRDDHSFIRCSTTAPRPKSRHHPITRTTTPPHRRQSHRVASPPCRTARIPQHPVRATPVPMLPRGARATP